MWRRRVRSPRNMVMLWLSEGESTCLLSSKLASRNSLFSEKAFPLPHRKYFKVVWKFFKEFLEQTLSLRWRCYLCNLQPISRFESWLSSCCQLLCWCTFWEAAGSGAWIPATLVESLDYVPSSWLQPGPALATAGIWEMNKQTGTHILSAC